MIERLRLTRPFMPSRLRWRLADAMVDGPAGFGLPPSGISTDGGGYWVADFGDMQSGTDAHHRSMRGLASRLRGGRRINVPYLEMAPTGGLEEVPFSDGETYSDGTGELAGLITAVLEEAVALRDDTALIRVVSGPNLRGSDVFSIFRSDVLGDEMHLCDSMIEVEPGLWSVTIGPQFRQAWPAGTEINFNNPHCGMRLQDAEGGLWPEATRGWNTRASAKFVEAFR